MPTLNTEGRWKAEIIGHGIEEAKTGSVQFKYTVRVTQMLHADGNWYDSNFPELGAERTGQQNIIKKDGELNQIGLDCIKECFGSVSFPEMNGDAYVGKIVQIQTAFHEYEGEQRIEIKYLSPENWEGFKIKPMDTAALKSLDAKYGSKLRAQYGATKPAAPPLKRGTDLKQPAPKMTAPPADEADLAPPPGVDDMLATPPDELALPPEPEAAPPATRDSAWKEVCKFYKGDKAKAMWKTLEATYSKDYDAITRAANPDYVPF